MPYGQGLLWQVDKAGLEPSYLFGTMHVPDPAVRDLPPDFDSKFDRATQAAFERVTEESEVMAAAERFHRATLLPDGEELSDLLGATAYAQLIRIAFRQRPSPIMMGGTHITHYKPWFVMLVVGKNDATESHLNSNDPTLDTWLKIRAKEAGKTLTGLETDAEQLSVFNDMPMDDQVAMLRAFLDNYNHWLSYATSADIYLKGDTALLYAVWLGQFGRLEPAVAQRFVDRILDARNHRMVERLLPLLEKASTFVAVGALHLPGEDGILALLEQRGFRVTPVY